MSRLGRNLRQRQPVNQKTPIQQAISLLRSFGTNAHVYIPGIGMLNGLQAANYIDSAGTQAGVVDSIVGRANDAVGVLGGELVTSGFNSGWGAVAGFTFAGSTLSISAGGGSSTCNGGPSAVVGASYQLSFDQVQTSGSISISFGGVAYSPSGTGIKSWTVTAITTGKLVIQVTYGGTVFSLSSAGVREISGIHASQTTTGSKPILRKDANGKYYWQFDGSNDSLQLGGPLFQASDDFCVVAAALQSGTNTGGVIESNAGSISSLVGFLDSSNAQLYMSAGGAGLQLTGAINAGAMNVICARKTGSTAVLRTGGIQRMTGSTAGIGSTLYTGGNIGKHSVGGGFLNGAIYPVIAIKGTVQDADLLLLEKLVASMSGVTI